MKKMVCITCPNSCELTIDETTLEVKGNKCLRGVKFAKDEITNPMRSVTSTVRTVFEDMPVLSVRTDGEIPKSKVFDLIKLLKDVTVDKRLKVNDIVIANVFGSEVNVISTKNM